MIKICPCIEFVILSPFPNEDDKVLVIVYIHENNREPDVAFPIAMGDLLDLEKLKKHLECCINM